MSRYLDLREKAEAEDRMNAPESQPQQDAPIPDDLAHLYRRYTEWKDLEPSTAVPVADLGNQFCMLIERIGRAEAALTLARRQEEIARRTCNENYDWAKREEAKVTLAREALESVIADHDNGGNPYSETQVLEQARAALAATKEPS